MVFAVLGSRSLVVGELDLDSGLWTLSLLDSGLSRVDETSAGAKKDPNPKYQTSQ
jgi:hypothetical protein